MHHVDQTTEQMVRSVLAYAENRLRMDPVPLDKGTRPAADLYKALDGVIRDRSRAPDEVLGIYSSVIAPTIISADSPRFLGFIPAAPDFTTAPEPSTQLRYSDEQLYALARYLYSLRPPPNPNVRDGLAQRGEAVFGRERCGACHTPPYYTSNKLLPATGFTVPPEHRTRYAILDARIGTDPTLTMQTRRGTGYYKVPSLLGVWYRGPFEHNGSVATLEEWFDPKRLEADYVPTGWTFPPGQPRPVPGHEFGLRLSADDKRALIAFLRTL